MAKEVIDTFKNEDGNIFTGQDLMDSLRESMMTVVRQPGHMDEPVYLQFHLGEQVFGIDEIQVERNVLTDGSEVFNFRIRLQQELASDDV